MAKKAKKKSTAKLPKQIAGVKVPKHLRETGGKLVEAMRHPLFADVVAAALIAAAAALRDNKGVRSATSETGQRASTLGTLLAATAADGVRKLATRAVEAKVNGGTGARPARRRAAERDGGE